MTTAQFGLLIACIFLQPISGRIGTGILGVMFLAAALLTMRIF
jgi:hypothetical protein